MEPMDPSVMAAVADPARLATLHASELLDTAPEEVFDRFTRLATQLLQVPIALLTLVDDRRQFMKSALGLGEPLASRREIPLSQSFCKHVVATSSPLIIEDAPRHPLVLANPGLSELGVMAYAGMPVCAPDGAVLGSFCAVDVVPRHWTADELASLRDLAATVTDEVGLRFEVAARRLAEKKLRDDRAFVAQAWDLLDAFMVVVGEDGSIRRTNRPCAGLVGLEPDELRGRDFVDTLMPESMRAEVTLDLQELLSGATGPLTWQADWLAADGTSRFIAWFASMMEEPARRRRYALVTGLDLSEGRRLEERFGTVLDAATENAIIGWDVDGVIELFNAGAERMLGYTAAEMIGNAPGVLLHDAEELKRRATELAVPPGFQALVALASRGEAETREWTFVRKDGGRLLVSLSVSAVRDRIGRITGYIGIAGDVTDRRQAEETLRLVHSLSLTMAAAVDFDSALEVALAEICMLTGWGYGEVWLPRPEGYLERSPTYFLADPGLHRLAPWIEGYRLAPGEGLAGRVWQTGSPIWVPDLASAGFGARTQLAVAAGMRVGVGVPMLAGDEVVAIIVFGHFQPRAEDQGLVRLISTVAAQLGTVILRKQAEAELQRQSEQLREQARLLELANDAIIVRLRDDSIVYWNRGAERLYGWTREQALGGNAPEMMHTRFPEPQATIYAELLASGRWEGELVHTTRQGRQIVVASRWTLQTDAQGNATGVMELNSDITDRKRAEQAVERAKEDAEEANRAKSDFLARMSHELRTPLNSVIGFTNILLKNKAGNLREQDLGFLGRIAANGRHLLELINDILDLSKIEARKVEIVPSPTSLAQLVADTLTHLPRPAEGVTLVTEVPEGLPDIRTDAGRLKQVLINLLSNALKFTESGTVTIAVELDARGRAAAIEVRDTGIGISPGRLDAIFDAFQQAETGTSRKYGGTGLGLAISRSLCDLLGCRLTACSALGQGSVFRVELPPPEAEPAVEALAGPHPAAPATTLHRILIVDDDADTRALEANLLAEIGGCELRMAANGLEALEAVGSFAPDLVLLDLVMPVMDGFEFLERVSAGALRLTRPAVVVTGKDLTPEDMERLRRYGVAIIAKGGTFERDLRRVVAAHLALPVPTPHAAGQ
jgi:PAS domain S-box-containing protein